MPQPAQAGDPPQHLAGDVLPPQSGQPGGRVQSFVVARVVVPLGEVDCASDAVVGVHRDYAMHYRMRLRRQLQSADGGFK